MGDFFLVIVMCIGGACQTMHDEHPHKSYDDCYQKSVVVAQEFKQIYPNTSGQCYCLTEEQYKVYLNSTEEQDRSIFDGENMKIKPKGTGI